VRQLHGLGLVVGDEQCGEPELALHRDELEAELLAHLGVDVGQRLVEQHELVVVDQGAGERDALLLTAAHLARVLLLQLTHPDELQGVSHAADDVVLRDLPALAAQQGVRHVLERRHVRPQRIRLEDHADVAALRWHLDGVLRGEDRPLGDGDGPLVGGLEPGDRPQQRRLAAAARAQQNHEITLRDLEGDVVDGVDDRPALPAEALHQVLHLDDRRRRGGWHVQRHCVRLPVRAIE
jgi:hypothetical protein